MSANTILAVDDNPQNLKLIRVLLQTSGYIVHTATDAMEALAILETLRPQMILMDIQMAGMDGMELSRRLKADPSMKEIKIVALTAYAMKGDEERILESGFDAYIPKPIDTRTLPDVIAAIINAQ